MKTKPFLLATAGSTVDGRVIDEKMLKEMADSYEPKTYGARLNIEHVRGVTGDGPFRAYGDVVELSIGEVDVNFNGKTEKRTALYGAFEVTDDAKKLNGAGQKVYPSIEIEPNFGGQGFAYLMGCALTDSPASIATERLQFNRTRPGSITVSSDEAAALEFAEAGGPDDGNSFLSKLNGMLDGFAAKFTPKQEEKPAAKPDDPAAPAAFDFTQLRPLIEDLGNSFNTAINGLRTEFRADADALAVKLKKLEDEAEGTPAPTFRQRPQSTGKNGNYAKTDC
ncbi:GPO family capsid scaffolding protein [Novosphingobium sp. SL115]|uniref:GPO family capsid scaffolding protein n=1 Tax=Novosphingobium sp. SL115 TaxID=2995150 RepID=UPI002275E087|nr:GPO family capsid scaffolding protein [Novosphingobium sp. SL115]MCY1672104.1 GPO family capsid scaffolding protein [Novosphingobium sp. SL115]